VETCITIKQESLADAKVSARQQCVYEGPWRRDLQQINDMRFLSNRGRIIYGLRDIFGCTGWKSPFRPLCSDCRPLAENAQQYQRNLCIAESTFIGLQFCRWQYIRFAVVASQVCEVTRNSERIRTYSSSGHTRSSTLVPIESAYATSY